MSTGQDPTAKSSKQLPFDIAQALERLDFVVRRWVGTNEEYRQLMDGKVANANDRIAALAAENARLRQTLYYISVVDQGCGGNLTYPEMVESAKGQASAAVGPQPVPEAKPSGFVPRDGDPNHDMTTGPCQCGAWHKEGDLP